MNDLQPQQTRKRKGCLFYGCLTLAVLFLAVLVGGGLGSYFLYKKAQAFVDQYSASEPMELPEVGYTETELEQFQTRLQVFTEGLAEGKPSVPLVLKGEDLNMLLASSSELKAVSDGVRLKVDGDEIKGVISLKLGDLGSPFFKDRYLNGEGSFKVSLTDGHLKVSATEILVNGEPLPEEYMAALREHNLAEGIQQNPDVMSTLSQLKSIEVRDGAVRVVPKSQE